MDLVASNGDNVELLKISELAERAGVQKATVAYYVREGLLPRPAKQPHRNMAYYSADTVERIKLIKELQNSRFLPLSVIKRLLADKQGVEEIRAFIHAQPLAPELQEHQDTGSSGSAAEADLTAEDLHHLEELDLVSPGKEGSYTPEDAALLRAIGQMKRAGLGVTGGFQAEELKMYRDAMETLISKEVALFAKRVVGERRHKREEVVGLARAGLEGTNALLIAMRRKLFLQLLDELLPPEK